MISSSNWRGPELVLFVLIQCTTLLSVLADGNNTIIAPTGGDILPVGMPYTIKWVPETAGPVKIVLQLDTGDIYPNITCTYIQIHLGSLLTKDVPSIYPKYRAVDVVSSRWACRSQ